MASLGTYLFLVVICFGTGISSTFVEVKCMKENLGQYGHQSILECHVNTAQVAAGARITVLTWKKVGIKLPLFSFVKGVTTLSPRFRLAEPSWNNKTMNVSLLIADTEMADAGKYKCIVITDRGDGSDSPSLTVTAKYNAPTIHSIPEKDIPANTNAALFCNAYGGYPEGRLRWFDEDNAEWTRSSEPQVTRTDDGRFNLSSMLTLLPGSVFSHYTCVVYNATGSKDGEITFRVPLKEERTDPSLWPKAPSKVIAPVLVIGSLIVGLLLWLVISRRRSAQARRCSTTPLMSYHAHDLIHTDGKDAEEGGQEADQCCQQTKGHGEIFIVT